LHLIIMSLLAPPPMLLRLLHESLPPDKSVENFLESDHDHEEVLSYVAFLAAGLARANEFDASVWNDVLQPYLDDCYNPNTTAAAAAAATSSSNAAPAAAPVDTKETVEKFRLAAEREYTDQDDAESYGGEGDEDVEEVCDLRFNLAYGGKILLHNTKLRLLRGRCYALVGQNGVGKTTLMNAINKDKIEGWPSHLKTAYVDSGSNVDPAFEQQIVLPYLIQVTQRSEPEIVEKMQQLEFTPAMMQGTIGALSGGWQMKLRLVRAVLQDPDIYLFDEPTK
jgi:elongation factor 3